MTTSTPRIDAHVHFFTLRDLQRAGTRLPYALPAPHSLGGYLDRLIGAGVRMALLNNVHLSILPDSSHVFASFAELAQLQRRDPGRYGGIRLVGTILADPAYATAQRLAHPQVQGVRIVLHDTPADAIRDDAYTGPDWQALFHRLRGDQHVHIYAQHAQANLKVLRQLPPLARVLIDHLGTYHAERGADEPAYAELLDEARRRGNVYFKGPGYRTATDPAVVAPFATRIIERVDPGRLLLEASDAPHVGRAARGSAYADRFTALAALDFSTRLAEAAARRTGLAAETLLRGACPDLFPSSR